ncbi:protein BPS1, chloroplastic-like [Quercus robur]|uniref:protein BPS1, chloroplastic-like n=1 Tax=Quercus robur TaxID=38942 RepID=UPI00216169E2|nr:protein BPS1, chloroplastic-like [Quercus robur]
MSYYPVLKPPRKKDHTHTKPRFDQRNTEREREQVFQILQSPSVFASAFSNFRRKLFDLNVDDKYLWAQALTGLQTSINSEIRNLYSTGRFTVLKELEAVNTSVKKLYPMIQDGVDFQRD